MERLAAVWIFMGFGHRCCPETLSVPDSVLEKHAASLRKYGAADLDVYAAIRYESQANWEISPDLLARLGRLNAHLLMTFYEEEV